MFQSTAVLTAFLLCAAPESRAAEPVDAVRAFAFLLYGNYFEDPCANTSGGKASCAPQFSVRRLDYRDDKARQVYVFGKSPCLVHAETTISATGVIYRADFNLQNVLYVNLYSAQQEGHLMELQLFLQGRAVMRSNGKDGNVLAFIHKYYASESGDVGHDIKAEVGVMRKAVRDYQTRYCSSMG